MSKKKKRRRKKEKEGGGVSTQTVSRAFSSSALGGIEWQCYQGHLRLSPYPYEQRVVVWRSDKRYLRGTEHQRRNKSRMRMNT